MPAASASSARRLWDSGLVAGAAAIAGWFGVSLWVAQFFPHIWPLAIAVLLFAFAGFRWIALLAWAGLYTLSRPEPPKRRAPQ